MKSPFRNAHHITLSLLLGPNPCILLVPAISTRSVSKSPPFRFPLTATLSSTSMAGGDSDTPQTSPSLEKQFEKFRVQLEDSGSLQERIRAVVLEIESTSRLMQASLLLVHQSKPIPVSEKAKTQINVLKDLFINLMKLLGNALDNTIVNDSDFGLDAVDYLVGICFMSNEMPRYVVNQVTAGVYDCPRKVLTDLHAALWMLNLRNDFLRKKFDSMRYDLRRVEEVYYDVKIQGLATTGDSVGDQGTQGQSSN